MKDRRIILLTLSDSAHADSLAAALDADGEFFATLTMLDDAADVVVSDSDGALQISATSPDTAGDTGATLPLNADDALVVAAIRLVDAGYRISSASEAADDLDDAVDVADVPVASDRPPLSARELEVLNLLADGAQNKVIARALNISVHTAKFHVASLLTKLGAVNRTDAIAIAMREGLVSM